MIAKLETGNGFTGALRYDVRAGKDVGLVKILDAEGVRIDYDTDGNLAIDPRKVGFDFRQHTMGYTGKGAIRKPVYHWALSYSPKDKVTEEQMVEDAKTFLHEIGFADTQYVMTAHYDKEHPHLHIITNIIDSQGKRIPTIGLIERSHQVAATITKDRGYTWGEKAKKEDITPEHIHKPHDRAREVIEPMIREALAKSVSLPDLQYRLIDEYGIMCNYTEAQDGKRGRISFCFEYEGQQHPFKGSDVARDLSFGGVLKRICENKKRQEIYKEISAGYNSIIPVMGPELNALKNNCKQLFRDTTDAGIVKPETVKKYKELGTLWKELYALNDVGRAGENITTVTEAIGGVLSLVNPIIGVSVALLAKIAGDVREASMVEQKQLLIQRIESVRNDITALEAKKSRIAITKSERLDAFLSARQCYQDYKDGLNFLDRELRCLKSTTCSPASKTQRDNTSASHSRAEIDNRSKYEKEASQIKI